MDVWLTRKYPSVFSHENPIPLAIDVSEELLAQLPDDISVIDFQDTMRWYCCRSTYLEAILKHDQRINLQGEFVSAVEEADKVAARKRLDEKNIQKMMYQTKSSKPKPVEIIEPMQPTEEVKEEKSTKLVLKQRKTVEPTADAIIESVAEVTPVKAETIAPVKVTDSNIATAKGLKVTMVIDPASIPNIDSTGMKKVTLAIQVANTDIQVTTDINAKSYRKTLSSIEEYGVDGCNVIIQGSMKQYGVIDDAGLVVQPKKQANAE
jgi:sRNA-binding protein